ncbi:lysozyme [Oculatella sp. LEGE 06141]|uniref:lysozyme n=1 Tax=Oculatella sp. LEGE 06141 TaxID=1828648 RepID=UPI001880B8FE|nr:lysozyme [Oculatella sp. LEGE 06141]MBE9178663.1 lysozyme [Oculatella sp. LEGE 06141]
MQLKTTEPTAFKFSTDQASQLAPDQKVFVARGDVFQIHSFEPTDNGHLRVVLLTPLLGRHEWIVFGRHVEVDGKPVEAIAPKSRQINQAGLSLIKEFEGCRLAAYKCPAGVPTIGYGSTKGVKMGMTITQTEAEALLRADLERFERAVERLVNVKLTGNQFAALVSFAFNVGVGALERSTLLRLLNQKQYQSAADQFRAWNKAGGRILPGLVRRRNAERELFLKD